MGYISKEGERIAGLLGSKNSDYAKPTDEFSNFKFAGKYAGLSPFDVIIGQLGIKIERFDNLYAGGDVREGCHESLTDTLRDMAGYALIAAAWMEKQNAPLHVATPNYNDKGELLYYTDGGPA